VQVRAGIAEPPQRRSIRCTRPPRPGRRRPRAVPDRGRKSRRRQQGRDPPEWHNPAPGGGTTMTGRGVRGRTGSSEGPRVRQADHPRYNQFVPRRCFVRVSPKVFILTAWRGSSEVGDDVRAALDQGEFAGPAYTAGTESRGPSALVPRSGAWDLAPLAASSRGGLASCGGMRREPDVRLEFPASGPSRVLREP
jgi:hypothetical protein